MCYTPEMSFGFALVGIAGILYLKNDTKHKYISYVIFFYVLMELLQTVQYYIVNDCENIWNRLLTEVAYLFVIVQPLLWNVYFYFNSKPMEQGLFKAAIGLALGWMFFNIINRVYYGQYESKTEKDSVYAGKKVCTYKGTSHLYWEWTSANMGDLNATFIMHLLIWFVPALLSTSQFLSAVLILAGALLSLGITAAMGDVKGFTAAWCYISIPIIAIVIGKDMY